MLLWARLTKHDWFLVAVVLGTLALVYSTCERMPANGGLGHDGYAYVEWARDFPRWVFRVGINPYQAQRVSVAALVYGVAQLFHLELTNKVALRLWRGLDLGCLALAAYLWCLVARRLGIGTRGRWFGASLLFVNFAVLKWSAYYVNLTDIPAFVLGMAMLYGYLAGRTWLLAAVTLVAAFTWPTTLYLGVMLLACPRKLDRPVGARPLLLHVIVGIGAALTAWLVLQYQHRRGGFLIGVEEMKGLTYTNLGILATAAYLLFSLPFILNDGRLFSWRDGLRRLGTLSLWVGVAVWALAQLGQKWLASQPSPISASYMLRHLIWSSVLSPGVFLVAHAVFYGPLFVLAVLLWKPICAHVQRTGVGITIVLACVVPLTLASESRRLINLVPFLVPFVVLAVEELHWSGRRYCVIVVLALLTSKVWMVMNPDWSANLLTLNVGPWMSYSAYAVQGALLLVVGFFLYPFTLRDEPPASVQPVILPST